MLAHVARDPEVSTRPYATRDERASRQEAFDRAGHERTVLSPVAIPEPVPVERAVEFGDPAEALRRLAERRRSLLIVIGSRGHGAVTAAMLGSVAGALAGDAPAPVVIVPAQANASRRPTGLLICGVDGSEHALIAARAAELLAARLDSSIELLHVAAPGQEGEVVDLPRVVVGLMPPSACRVLVFGETGARVAAAAAWSSVAEVLLRSRVGLANGGAGGASAERKCVDSA